MTFDPALGTNQELEDLRVSYRTTTPDTDFLEFGYWVTTTETGSEVRHVIDTFAIAEGHGALAADVTSLQGKATYNGPAAGIYVHKAGIDDSLAVSNGEFVASASLTAQFGVADGSAAAADQWAVTGKISGFQSTNGGHDLSSWDLMLGKADLGDRDATAGTATATNADFVGFTGKTSGGAGTVQGDWSGTFFGGAPETSDTDTADDFPTAAIGEFNGHFVNGHVAGAFGVEYDD